MLEAEHQFRRVIGCRGPGKLAIAVQGEVAEEVRETVTV